MRSVLLMQHIVVIFTFSVCFLAARSDLCAFVMCVFDRKTESKKGKGRDEA